MEYAIFCFLAFCALQTVFADDYPTVKYILRHDETIHKYDEALRKLEKPFWDVAFAVEPKGTDSFEMEGLIINCMTEASNRYGLHKKLDIAAPQCDQCYDEAEKTKNIKAADKCCDKVLAVLVKKLKKSVDRSVACVAKCVKLGADCPKMLKKLLE